MLRYAKGIWSVIMFEQVIFAFKGSLGCWRDGSINAGAGHWSSSRQERTELIIISI